MITTRPTIEPNDTIMANRILFSIVISLSVAITSYATQYVSYELKQTKELITIKELVLKEVIDSTLFFYKKEKINENETIKRLHFSQNESLEHINYWHTLDCELHEWTNFEEVEANPYAYFETIKVRLLGKWDNNFFTPYALEFYCRYSDEYDIPKEAPLGIVRMIDIQNHATLSGIPIFTNFGENQLFDSYPTRASIDFSRLKRKKKMNLDDSTTTLFPYYTELKGKESSITLKTNDHRTVQKITKNDFDKNTKTMNQTPQQLRYLTITDYFNQNKFSPKDSVVLDTVLEIPTLSSGIENQKIDKFSLIKTVFFDTQTNISYGQEMWSLLHTYHKKQVVHGLIKNGLTKTDSFNDFYMEVEIRCYYEKGILKYAIPQQVHIYVSSKDVNNTKSTLLHLSSLPYSQLINQIRALKLSELDNYISNYEEHETYQYWKFTMLHTLEGIENGLVEFQLTAGKYE